MSLLLPDSGLLFWMFLSFGIVFVILAKYGFPVIIKMVEGRKTYIDQSLEVAREANAQLSFELLTHQSSMSMAVTGLAPRMEIGRAHV